MPLYTTLRSLRHARGVGANQGALDERAHDVRPDIVKLAAPDNASLRERGEASEHGRDGEGFVRQRGERLPAHPECRGLRLDLRELGPVRACEGDDGAAARRELLLHRVRASLRDLCRRPDEGRRRDGHPNRAAVCAGGQKVENPEFLNYPGTLWELDVLTRS